jgi:peroxiredoxin
VLGESLLGSLRLAQAKPIREIQSKFGLDYKQVNGDDEAWLPLAATYIIDRSGTIKYAFVDVDYRHRMDPTKVVPVLQKLTKPGACPESS